MKCSYCKETLPKGTGHEQIMGGPATGECYSIRVRKRAKVTDVQRWRRFLKQFGISMVDQKHGGIEGRTFELGGPRVSIIYRATCTLEFDPRGKLVNLEICP